MSRMKVNVGVVFTQAMFCDKSGKIHYHKVMTDVDKPWVSVVEAIAELMPKQPIPCYLPVDSLDIQINFTNVNHTEQSILEQLHYPEIHTSDVAFRFEQPNDVELLIQFTQEMDESIYDSMILTKFAEQMVFTEEIHDRTNYLKEVFHQQLARLYEGDNVWCACPWDEEDLVAVNTS